MTGRGSRRLSGSGSHLPWSEMGAGLEYRASPASAARRKTRPAGPLGYRPVVPWRAIWGTRGDLRRTGKCRPKVASWV
jgi:hypothetical protein